MSQESKVYNFKGTGTIPEDHLGAFPDKLEDFPIGIATPLRFSSKSGTLFEMHTNLMQQIKDNFRNMVATNHGERLMLTDFGANLKPLSYELGSEAGDTQAISRISATTKKYMPFIELETFEPLREQSTDGSLSRIGVRVTFSVPALAIGPQTIDAMILSAG